LTMEYVGSGFGSRGITNGAHPSCNLPLLNGLLS